MAGNERDNESQQESREVYHPNRDCAKKRTKLQPAYARFCSETDLPA